MLLHLGNVYQRSFRLEDHVMPVLQSLVQTTGESAAFHVREKKQRLCLFRVDSKHSIRDHIQVGDVGPLSKGAAGRVLTAFENGPDESQRLPFVSIGEIAPDGAGIAVPVFGPHNRLVGALVLTGPTTRFTKAAISRMGRVLSKAGEALTAEIGGNLDEEQRARRRASR
jgi:DNA-binding IclR family transcriptional regulator